MKKIILIFAVAACTALAISAQSSSPTIPDNSKYVRPDAGTRFRRYVGDTVGPFAWAGIAAGAGFSTVVNTPNEWGKTADGFGKRFASGFGTSVIKNTTIYGLDEAFRLDSHYYRSKKRDAGSRIANALVSTVTARTPSGARTIGVPRIAGSYASSVIAVEAWYPARYNWKEGAKNGTISLGVDAMLNLLKEFVWKK